MVLLVLLAEAEQKVINGLSWSQKIKMFLFHTTGLQYQSGNRKQVLELGCPDRDPEAEKTDRVPQNQQEQREKRAGFMLFY